MNLDALNKIATEAKELDSERNMIVSARLLVKSTADSRDSLVHQLMEKNGHLNNYGSPQQRNKIVQQMLSEVIESIRGDLLESIDSRLAAQEKQLFIRAADKRQLITASIVAKSADTDGGAS